MTFDLEGFKSKVMWIPSLTPITHKQGQFADGLETTVHKIGGSFTYNLIWNVFFSAYISEFKIQNTSSSSTGLRLLQQSDWNDLTCLPSGYLSSMSLIWLFMPIVDQHQQLLFGIPFFASADHSLCHSLIWLSVKFEHFIAYICW